MKNYEIEKRLEQEDFEKFASSPEFHKSFLDLIRGLTGDYTVDLRIPKYEYEQKEYLAYISASSLIGVNPFHPYFSSLPYQKRIECCIGLILHECAHYLFTSFLSLYPQPTLYNNLFHHVLNILEDARIERLSAFMFPGLSYTLDILNNVLYENGKKEAAEQDTQIDNLSYILNYLLVFLVFGKKQEKVREDLQDIWNQIKPIALEARRSDSFSECEKRCHEITQLLIDQLGLEENDSGKVKDIELNVAANIRNEQSINDNKQLDVDTDGFDNMHFDDNPKDTGDQTDQSNAEDKSDQSQESKEEQKDGEENGKSQNGDKPIGENRSGSEQNYSDGNQEGNSDEVKQIIEQMLQNYKNNEDAESKDFNTYRIDYSRKDGSQNKNRFCDDNLMLTTFSVDYSTISKYDERMKHLSKPIKETITRFKRYLNNNQDELIRYTHSGKIDGKSLSRILTGNVCAVRKERCDETNLNVTLLIDFSGSMSYRCKEAIDACIILIETCSFLHIPLTINGFQGDRFLAFSNYKDKRKNSKYCIVEADAAGSTPMGKALAMCENHFAKMHYQDKLLVCITDGEPNDISSVKYELAKLQRDVIVYGLGIRQNLSELFSNNIMINDVSDLPKEFEKILKHHLLKQ